MDINTYAYCVSKEFGYPLALIFKMTREERKEAKLNYEKFLKKHGVNSIFEKNGILTTEGYEDENKNQL